MDISNPKGVLDMAAMIEHDINLLTVACVQMCSGCDVLANLDTAEKLIRRAQHAGADIIVTPEMTAWLDQHANPSTSPVSQEIHDVSLKKFRDLAVELDVDIVVGSLAIRSDNNINKYINRSFLLNRHGQIQLTYDKLHLFDVFLSDDENYQESSRFEAGSHAALTRLHIPKRPSVNLGMSVCYDVRFPELYQQLALAGADIITIPAAFTQQTGMDHWHVLTRARAIETGCFIVAAGQGGMHQDGRHTYGHSMIISPWGTVLAEAEAQEETVIYASIDIDEVQRCRDKIPNLKHRRYFNVPTLK